MGCVSQWVFQLDNGLTRSDIEVSFPNRSLHDGWCYIDPKLARIFGEAIARKGLKFLTTF